MSPAIAYILVAVVAYLLGSISVGIVVSKLFHGPDLHKVGSGSTGASNVLRTMGTKWGLITLFGDFAKAVLACGIAWWTIGTIEAAMLAGLACILGHNWPIFFKMEGGKGVAASCGVALMTFPIAGVVSILTCIAVIAIWRYISLGSMVFVTGSVVVPFTSDTTDICWLVTAFTTLDLPALRLPKNPNRQDPQGSRRSRIRIPHVLCPSHLSYARNDRPVCKYPPLHGPCRQTHARCSGRHSRLRRVRG